MFITKADLFSLDFKRLKKTRLLVFTHGRTGLVLQLSPGKAGITCG